MNKSSHTSLYGDMYRHTSLQCPERVSDPRVRVAKNVHAEMLEHQKDAPCLSRILPLEKFSSARPLDRAKELAADLPLSECVEEDRDPLRTYSSILHVARYRPRTSQLREQCLERRSSSLRLAMTLAKARAIAESHAGPVLSESHSQ
jgi:hypothetical protein